jgi:hypothetical protein
MTIYTPVTVKRASFLFFSRNCPMMVKYRMQLALNNGDTHKSSKKPKHRSDFTKLMEAVLIHFLRYKYSRFANISLKATTYRLGEPLCENGQGRTICFTVFGIDFGNRQCRPVGELHEFIQGQHRLIKGQSGISPVVLC